MNGLLDLNMNVIELSDICIIGGLDLVVVVYCLYVILWGIISKIFVSISWMVLF